MNPSFFYLILGMAIFGIAANCWPWNSKLGLYAFMSGYALWYIWRFFVDPFLTALKEKDAD